MFKGSLGRRGLITGIIMVLGPAIIGGLFTIAPTIYQQITTPRAVLTYSRTAGPAISTPSGFVQISTFTIENSGRVPLTGIVVDVSADHGQIQSYATNTPKGVVTKEQNTSKEYFVNVERLLPRDVVRASIMTSSNTSDDPLSVAVRSNEVVGAEAVIGNEARSKDNVLKAASFALLGTVVAAMGVLFSTFFFLRGRLGGAIFYGREDLIRYVLVLSQIAPLKLEAFMDDHKMSYIGAGDLLLEAGLRGDAETKSKCIAAMKALLNATMVETSAVAIRENLERLRVSLNDEDFAKTRKNATRDVPEARRRAAAYFPLAI